MSAQHTPEGEWFYTAYCPEDSQPSADGILDECGLHEIVEVGGAREVWKGFGFLYRDAADELASAWFATEAEAVAALDEIERKQREAVDGR